MNAIMNALERANERDPDREVNAIMGQKRPRCAYSECGKQFRQGRADQVYCESKCGQAHRRRMKAAGVTNGHHKARVNKPVGFSYAEALGHLPMFPDTYGDDLPSDEEYMKTLMSIVLPDGTPTRPDWDQRVSTEEPIPMQIVIRNVPTRFPGTPLHLGRQLVR